MNRERKSILKNSFWNFFGGVLPAIIGFVSLPFAIEGLGEDGFGILTIGWIVLGYFGLFDLGFSQATTKFSSQYLSKGEVEKFNVVFWVSLVTSLGMGFIGSIFFFVFTPFLISHVLTIPAELIGDAKNTFLILGGMLPFIIATTSLRGVMAASERFDLLNKIQVPSNVLTYIIPCLSYFVNINLTIVIILISIMRMSIFLIYLYYTVKLHPYISSRPIFDKEIFRSMLGFGGWISLSNFASPLLVYLDRFLIGSLISVKSVTFYTAPYELIIRMRLFPNAIMEAIFPKFSSVGKDDDISSISVLFLKSFKYISIIMSLVVFVLVTYSYEILHIWLGKSFADTSNNVLQILTVGLFFNAIATVPFFLLQGIGRPDIPAKIHFVEVMIFSVMFYFMIAEFGLTGAAITWACRTFVDFLLMFVATHHVQRELFEGEDLKLVIRVFIILPLIIALSFSLKLVAHSVLFGFLLSVGLGVLLIYLIWSITLTEAERCLIEEKGESIVFQLLLLFKRR